MKKTVNYVKLQGTDTFIPGIGGLGSTLPPASKTVNLKMWVDSEFPTILFLTVNGRDSFIPLANVQIATTVADANNG